MSNSAAFRVAVLGQGPSVVALARELSKSVEVHIFKHQFDPARSIFSKQPLCDYQSKTFILRDHKSDAASRVCNDADNDNAARGKPKETTKELVLEEFRRWETAGLIVQEAKQNRNWKIGRVIPQKGASAKIEQVKLQSPSADTRFLCAGCLFSTVDKLIESLKVEKNIFVHYKILEKMWPISVENGSGKTDSSRFQWVLSSMNSQTFGPFDIVVMCQDHNPRHTRRAGFKSVMEQNMKLESIEDLKAYVLQGKEICPSVRATSSRLAASIARSVMPSAMAVLVEIYNKDIIEGWNKLGMYDSLILPREVGHGAIKWVARRAAEDMDYRSVLCQGSDYNKSLVAKEGADQDCDGAIKTGSLTLKAAANGNQEKQTNRMIILEIVSSAEWSYSIRKTHSGGWDKQGTGEELVKIFVGEILNLPDPNKFKYNRDFKFVSPTFHWTGASCLTKMKCAASDGTSYKQRLPCCMFDALSSLGYCGDVCGGLGPEGSVKSGIEMAQTCLEWCNNVLKVDSLQKLDAFSSLPLHPEDWEARVPRKDEDCIWTFNEDGKSFTGRKEPQDGLDHSWEIAAQLNHILCNTEIAGSWQKKSSVDSLKQYRLRPGAWQQLERDKQMDRKMPESATGLYAAGRSSARKNDIDDRTGGHVSNGLANVSLQDDTKIRRRWGSKKKDSTSDIIANGDAPDPKSFKNDEESGAANGQKDVQCDELDPKNVYKFVNLLQKLGLTQDDVLESLFPPGTWGICGAADEGGKIKPVGDKILGATFDDLGQHGQHEVFLDNKGNGTSSLVQEICEKVQTSLPASSGLTKLDADHIKVTFESLLGRRIGPGKNQQKSLCGWSNDHGKVGEGADPKLLLFLGNCQSLTMSYKYSKQDPDKDKFDILLKPGDVVLFMNDSRNWVQACTEVIPQTSSRNDSSKAGGKNMPFDFSHVWIQDHRPLKKKRLEMWQKIHDDNSKKPDKWFQNFYEIKRSLKFDVQSM